MRQRRKVKIAVAGAVALVVTGGGGGSSGGTSGGSAAPAVPKVPMLQQVGPGEGELDLVNWAGYAEDGSNDKTVDWVHPFEKATGCTVRDKVGNTSDEMVQ